MSGLAVANIASIPVNLAAQRIVPCFPAGTPILTLEGHTNIEEFRAGDLVMSQPDSDDGNTSPTPQLVEEVFVREGRLFEVAAGGTSTRVT